MFQGQTAVSATGHALLTSVTFTLEPGRQRRAQLEQLLEDLLQEWGLPARADRYAASVTATLALPEPLELFVQVDRVSQLLTVELWSGGRFLYGLDDWVG